MNVGELKQKYQSREILPDSHVMLTGTMLEFWQTIDKGQGWSFTPVKFGDPGEWIRLSFKDAPSDGSFQALQGLKRTWTVEVKDYQGKPSCTVLNTLEQMQHPATDDGPAVPYSPALADPAAPPPTPSSTTSREHTDHEMVLYMKRWAREFRDDPEITPEQIQSWVATLAIALGKQQFTIEPEIPF